MFNVVGVVSRIFLLTPFFFFWKQEVDRYDDLNKRLQDMGFTGVYKVWAFLSCTLNHVYPFLFPVIVDCPGSAFSNCCKLNVGHFPLCCLDYDPCFVFLGITTGSNWNGDRWLCYILETCKVGLSPL